MMPLEKLSSAWINLIKAHIQLFKLEAKLAHKSFFSLSITLVLLFIVAIGFWLVLTVMIGYLVYLCIHQVFLSILSAFIVNLMILTFLAFMARQFSSQMLFKNTRELLSHYIRRSKDENI